MNGPEHYCEAEILLGYATGTSTNYDETNPAAALLFAQAQVHATLALTAATAMQAAVDGSEPGMGSDEFSAWYRVAGVKLPADADDPDEFSASELREMDQADESALDAAAEAESATDTEGQR